MITGEQIVDRADDDLGKDYVLGAFVPKDVPNWPGPFDCAEAASYWLFQAAKILFGVSQHEHPHTADAYTGYWLSDAKIYGNLASVEECAKTPGAYLLRVGIGSVGHVVLCDGKGGTREAASAKLGVVKGYVAGRRWTHGIRVPGIKYETLSPVILPTVRVIRLTDPYMVDSQVGEIQHLLGLKEDNIYGPLTYAAVLNFQRSHGGLVVDGEVGNLTLTALREAA